MMIGEKFTITEQGYIVGKLLDGTGCQILLDTRASRSFMSKFTIYIVNHYIHYQSLHQKHREFK